MIKEIHEEGEGFELLLADISARFINVPTDGVDAVIVEAQRRVCEWLGVDISALWQWGSDSPDSLLLTHYHRGVEGPPVPGRMSASEHFPWAQRHMEEGKILILGSTDDAPAEASRDVASWRHFHVKATVLIPLSVGEQMPFGALSFNDLRQSRAWPDALVNRLVLVARIFSNVLVRKRMEQELKEREAHLSMAIEAANAGSWVLDAEREVFRMSDPLCDLLGLPRGNSLSMEQLMAMVYAEDRQLVSSTIRSALRHPGAHSIEYRIVRPDGRIRWFQSSGGLRRHGVFGDSVRLLGITADITEHKLLKAALEESHAQVASVMNSTDDFIWSVEPEHFALRTWNRAFGNYYRQNRGIELKAGMTLADMFPPEFAVLWNDYFERVLREGTFSTEYEVVAQTHVLLLSLHAMRRDGKVFGISVFGKDITERKKARDAARLRELRLTSAVELAGLVFYELAGAGGIAFLDGRIPDVLGCPVDMELSAVYPFWQAHLHPDDAPGIVELAQKLHEGVQERVNVEYRYMHPLRGLIWLSHYGLVISRDADGKSLRTIGAIREITEQKTAELELKRTVDEVKRLRDRLQTENIYLREQISSGAGHGTIVGESEPIQRMLAMARKVAPTESAVLITGETGTGKELLAQAIHDLSPRKKKIMVKVNCAALPALLIESELFGREKGAYTGAATRQAGRFEAADGSTIFLDEIGDLPLDLQSKLLRILQDGRYERLGSHRTIQTDVRLIAATNRNLADMVRKGKFREDLYHRLDVFPIVVPPLRERVDDIPLLVWTFVQEFNAKMGRLVDSVPRLTMEKLKQHPWNGNVRELRNIIERAMILNDGHSLKLDIPEVAGAPLAEASTLEEVERRHIIAMLERTRWRISGKGGGCRNPRTGSNDPSLAHEKTGHFAAVRRGVNGNACGPEVPTSALRAECGYLSAKNAVDSGRARSPNAPFAEACEEERRVRRTRPTSGCRNPSDFPV